MGDDVATETERWFAREGFCFRFEPLVLDGVFTLRLHYENCFSGAMVVDVQLDDSQAALSEVVRISCGGGEQGTLAWPWAVPKTLQGRQRVFRLSADVHFVDEPGEVVSDRAATPVPARSGTLMRLMGRLSPAVVNRPGRSATLELELPEGVADKVAGGSTEPLAHPVVQVVLLTILVGLFVLGLILVLIEYFF